MTIHCNLTPEEKNEAFHMFPQYLDDEEEEAISAEFTQYCFYETYGRKDFRECFCTRCGGFELYKGEDQNFFRYHHRDEIECPNCGEDVIPYAMGRMRTGSSLEEWKRAAFLRPGPNGEALIEAGYGSKQYSFQDLKPHVDWTPTVLTYLAPGKRMQWRRHAYTSFFNQMFYDPKEWEASPTVKEPFNPYMYTSDGSYLWIGGEKLEGTSLRYCQLNEWYLRNNGFNLDVEPCRVRQVYRYLAAYTEYPNLEMAVKLGLYGAVDDLVMAGKKNHKYLNWSGKNLPEFLRMSKQDAKEFLKQERTFSDLKSYRELKKNGQVDSLRKYINIFGNIGSAEQMEKLGRCAKAAGVDLIRAARYAESQLPQCSRAGYSMGTILQYWEDYLDMAAKLQYDLTEQTVAMPKDLKGRHDTAASLIKVQASAEARKKYQARYQNLKKLYEFSYGDLVIVVPESSQDIVQEGKTLHHCVGGYAERHISGAVDILFLRHARKPNVPFLTIEMRPRKSPMDKITLVQIHGYRNEEYQKKGHCVDMEDKYDWFLDAWFAWMRAGSKRDKNGKPVMPAGPAGKEQTA